MLLDAVYRSIDLGEEEKVTYLEGMRKKQNYSSDPGANLRGVFRNEEAMENFQRACMIQKLMEKKLSEKSAVRRNLVDDLKNQKKPRNNRGNSKSRTSSSDSSCGGGRGLFFSSEGETLPIQRPKPVRTRGSEIEKVKLVKSNGDSEINHSDRRVLAARLEHKAKHESGFLKTKSRALKMYCEFKKVKQPTSPGGKLAGFLNSLFTNGNLKKHKTVANSDDSPSLKSSNTSTCSSASSFSRSCLSKTPSSGGKSSNISKKSVKFLPVSLIIDDDYDYRLPKLMSLHKINHDGCTANNLHHKSSDFELFKISNDRNFRNVVNEEYMLQLLEKNQMFDQELEVDEDDDDDAASYASSDLFELENLSAIGLESYGEELPVYGTTHLHTNRTIANGLIQ